MSSPTTRTLDVLETLGYRIAGRSYTDVELDSLPGIAKCVESYNPRVKVKSDLFGVIDILAIHPDHGTLGIQATSDSNHAARVKKIQDAPSVPTLLLTRWQLEVWSWGKRGARGKQKKWTVRRERAVLSDGIVRFVRIR